MQILKEFWKSYSWLFLRIAQVTIILLMVVTVFMLLNQDYPMRFDSVGVQARIEKSDAVGPWVKQHPLNTTADEALRYYMMGALFSESVAAAISVNYDLAKQKLAKLADMSPASSRVPEMVEQFDEPMTRNDKKTLIYIYRLLQETLQEEAGERGSHDRILFQWGTWLVDLSLVAAMDDKLLAFQLKNLFSRQADYFKDNLPSSSLPYQAISASLDELTGWFHKSPHSDEDMQAILEQVQDLQQLTVSR